MNNNYIPITKAEAVTRLGQGAEIVLCPSNLRLNTSWHCEAIIDLLRVIGEDHLFLGNSKRENRQAITKLFDRFLNHYRYYNCNDETGNKVNYFKIV